jgi:hypothetical protein
LCVGQHAVVVTHGLQPSKSVVAQSRRGSGQQLRLYGRYRLGHRLQPEAEQGERRPQQRPLGRRYDGVGGRIGNEVVLRVAAPEKGLTFTDLAEDARCRTIGELIVPSDDLHAGRIHRRKGAAAVPVRQRLGRRLSPAGSLTPDLLPRLESDPSVPGARLGVVLEARPDGAVARPGVETELPVARNLELGADLELDATAGVVGSGADPEVASPLLDVSSDAGVGAAVQVGAVGEVAAAGEDQQGGRLGPGILGDLARRDRHDVVRRGQEAMEGGFAPGEPVFRSALAGVDEDVHARKRRSNELRET